MSLKIKSVRTERQKRECRGSQSGSYGRRLKSKSLITIVLVSLLVSLLTTSLATPVSAQEDYIVTIGQDEVVTFTECNYHYAWFGNDPINPNMPWPDQREAYSEGNTAHVSLLATPGHAGVAGSRVGVDFEWNLGPYTWEEVEDWPVNVTVDFSYQIGAYWTTENEHRAYGFAVACVGVWGSDDWQWDDIINVPAEDEPGSRSGSVSVMYTTTVGELGGRIVAQAYCHAHSGETDTMYSPTQYSSIAEVQVNSIKIEFLGPQITHFTVSLGHYVGPNEEEWYGQQVMASVYHPEGSEQIESFIAVDPTGEELPNVTEECSITPDSWDFMWWEGYLPNPPTFGEYTIIATDKDGRIATVTSWPTDHISDRVPTITMDFHTHNLRNANTRFWGVLGRHWLLSPFNRVFFTSLPYANKLVF